MNPVATTRQPVHHLNPAKTAQASHIPHEGPSAVPHKSLAQTNYFSQPAPGNEMPDHMTYRAEARHFSDDSRVDSHGGPGKNVTYSVNDNGHRINVTAPRDAHVEVHHFEGPVDGPKRTFNLGPNLGLNAHYGENDHIIKALMSHPGVDAPVHTGHPQALAHGKHEGQIDEAHPTEHQGVHAPGSDVPEANEEDGKKGGGVMKKLLIGGGVLAALAAIIPMFGGSSSSPGAPTTPPGGGGWG
jgi:hypothetical protein